MPTDHQHPHPRADPHPAPAGAGRRAVRIGIGGPVGSGKTALVAALCRQLRDELSLAVVTNDIYTTEDAEFLLRQAVLPPERIRAVETGCCPHTAIRDDIAANLDAIETLEAELAAEPQPEAELAAEPQPEAELAAEPQPVAELAAEPEAEQGGLDLILVESGGDNLTATFSKGLVDVQIFVIDVAGGDKVPRKGGPGVSTADLLVINKTDLAPLVGADLSVMARDAAARRGDAPTVFLSLTEDPAAAQVVGWVRGKLAR